MLTSSEKSLLSIFRRFLVRPGEMLCIDGPTQERHRRAINHLADQGLIIRERFRGAFTLTDAGFAVMTELRHDGAV